MSMAQDLFCFTVLLTISFAAILSVVMDISGCRCLISSRAVCSSSPLPTLAYIVPILASVAEDMVFLISLQTLWTVPFSSTLVSSGFLGLLGLLLKKQYQPVLLLAFGAL
eukprot:14295896-Ditylum_brightwellii.AAC.1